MSLSARARPSLPRLALAAVVLALAAGPLAGAPLAGAPLAGAPLAAATTAVPSLPDGPFTFVGKSDEFHFFLETDSPLAADDGVIATLLVANSPLRHIGQTQIAFAVAREHMICASWTYYPAETEFYTRDGAFFSGVDGDGKPRPIPPNSAIDAAARIVCDGKPYGPTFADSEAVYAEAERMQ